MREITRVTRFFIRCDAVPYILFVALPLSSIHFGIVSLLRYENICSNQMSAGLATACRWVFIMLRTHKAFVSSGLDP
jgi:hypothetical protein